MVAGDSGSRCIQFMGASNEEAGDMGMDALAPAEK
jgi:hypothetical protein